MTSFRPLLIVLVIWCAGLGAAGQFGKFSVAFPALSDAYPTQIGVGLGLLVSIVGIVGLVFGANSGNLVGTIGHRRVLAGALGLGALVSAVQALLPGFSLMFLLRVAEGFSHLGIVIAGPTLIASTVSGPWRGAAMTLWSSFFGVAFAIMFHFGPDLLAEFGLWALFLPHAGWMALCFAAVLIVLPLDSTPVQKMTGGDFFAFPTSIYSDPWIAAPALGFICYTVTFVAVLTLLPGRLGPEGPWIAVAMPLVSIGFSLTFGIIALRFVSAVHLVQGGFFIALFTAAGFWWAPDWRLAFLMAAAFGLVQGASFAALSDLNTTADTQAKAAGAMVQLGNLGTTTGTPILVICIDLAGNTGLAIFVAVFSAAGIWVHWFLAHKRARSA